MSLHDPVLDEHGRVAQNKRDHQVHVNVIAHAVKFSVKNTEVINWQTCSASFCC